MKIVLLLVLSTLSLGIQAQPVKIQGGAKGGGDEPLNHHKHTPHERVLGTMLIDDLDELITKNANKHFKKCMGKQYDLVKFKSSVDLYNFIVLQENFHNPIFQLGGLNPALYQCPYKSDFENNCLATIPFRKELKSFANDKNFENYVRLKLHMDTNSIKDMKTRFSQLSDSEE